MSLYNALKVELLDAWRFRYVVVSFVQSKLKQRYRRSFLGFLWTILAPLSHYAIIGFVMSHIGRADIPNYFVYMFTGSVFFSVFANIMNGAPGYLIGNEHFIKKIYLPKVIFVFNSIFLEFTNFLLTSSALLILGIFTQSIEYSNALLFLPIPLFFTFLMLTGLSAFISVIAVYFRDLIHIIPAVMQAAFFLTPILYTPESLPPGIRQYIYWNPIYYVIECFRIPIVSGRLPNYIYVLGLIFLSIIIGLLGLIVLKKYDNKIVFRL